VTSDAAPVANVVPMTRAEQKAHLQNAEITGVSASTRSGVNQSMIVTLRDGTKGVLKPVSGERTRNV